MPEIRAQAALEPSYQGRRALIIEDNAAAGQCLVQILERLGIQASLVADGAEAIAAIERSRAVDFPYDYIFVDANMDSPVGFALAESWRNTARHERLLVMLTTENQRHDLARLRELEVSAHLVKPIGAEDLIDALALAEGTTAGLELASFDLGSTECSLCEN